MLLFMIKKAFFDMWDNFLAIILLNLGFVAVLSVPLLVFNALAPLASPVSIIPLVAGVLLLFVYSGAASMVTRDISDYKSPEFRSFFVYLKDTWAHSLFLGGVYVLHIFVLVIALPFYASIGSLLGLAALVFLFWASVIWMLSSQFFYPIRARLDRKLPKIIRKCFIVFFDNTGFSIFLGIGAAATLAISIFTALLIPGVAGLLLWLNVGFKLRLLKYDYLEANPEANRKQIPWDALLVDEREKVGKRSLRGMIFPWKE
ncbi:hypothetical protein [Salinispira pacifica]